jgi:hypothetical protein
MKSDEAVRAAFDELRPGWIIVMHNEERHPEYRGRQSHETATPALEALFEVSSALPRAPVVFRAAHESIIRFRPRAAYGPTGLSISFIETCRNREKFAPAERALTVNA